MSLTPESTLTQNQTADAIPELDTPEVNPHGPFAALRRLLPKGEVIRFLIVGGGNTAFSIAMQAAFGVLFTWLYPHASQSWIAIAAVVCADCVCIRAP